MLSRLRRWALGAEQQLGDTADDHHYRRRGECQEDLLVTFGVDHAAEYLRSDHAADSRTNRIEDRDAQGPGLHREYL